MSRIEEYGRGHKKGLAEVAEATDPSGGARRRDAGGDELAKESEIFWRGYDDGLYGRGFLLPL
jgi:hypothetical protein